MQNAIRNAKLPKAMLEAVLRIGTMRATKFLLVLLCLSPNINAQQKAHSAVLGDLRVTLTAVRDATGEDIQEYKLHSKSGYHSVLVFLKVRNVANYPNCTLLSYWLGVIQEYQYKGGSLSGKNGLKTYSLPPSEESEGVLDFQIKDGTKPATLKILRNEMVDTFCAQKQHRERRIASPTTVRFSFHGLPTKSD